MDKFENALSNDVYHREDGMIEKRYKLNTFKKIFKNQESKVLEKLGYKFKSEDNKLILEYFENESFNDKNMTDQDIINVANALKELHALDTSGIELSRFEDVYEDFYEDDDEILIEYPIDGTEYLLVTEAISILEKGEQVILHNDVVEGNLLKIDNKIKLIDFEYSGLGNKLFDIASFLTEREINDDQKELFISQFENVDRDELKTVCTFLQIFWTRWALYQYSITEKEIYKLIADWKFEQYLKLKK